MISIQQYADFFNEGVEVAFGEVLAPTALRYQDGIYGFELAAVDGDEFSAVKIAFPTEKGKGAADLLDCFAEGPGQGGYLVESQLWSYRRSWLEKSGESR